MKTAIVTGSNTGIGRATAFELARKGMRGVMALRHHYALHPGVVRSDDLSC